MLPIDVEDGILNPRRAVAHQIVAKVARIASFGTNLGDFEFPANRTEPHAQVAVGISHHARCAVLGVPLETGRLDGNRRYPDGEVDGVDVFVRGVVAVTRHRPDQVALRVDRTAGERGTRRRGRGLRFDAAEIKRLRGVARREEDGTTRHLNNPPLTIASNANGASDAAALRPHAAAGDLNGGEVLGVPAADAGAGIAAAGRDVAARYLDCTADTGIYPAVVSSAADTGGMPGATGPDRSA